MPYDRNAVRRAYDRMRDDYAAERNREDEDVDLLDTEFEIVWRRIVNDEMGGDACFVLARKP